MLCRSIKFKTIILLGWDEYMRQGIGLKYYVVFQTTAPDGSKFFGIQATQNPSFGSDGEPWTYIGNGPRLAQKAKQFGIHRLIPTVIQVHGDYDSAKRQLDNILATDGKHPLCLNMPLPEKNEKISESLTDLPKSDSHKQAISSGLQGNQNALGMVHSEESKEAISEAHQKQKWWHKKETGEEIQLPADEEGLTGFELGRLPKEYKKNFKRDRKAQLSDADRARIIGD